MDHKLLLQLLQNKTEEIQSLLSHFKNNPDDLKKGLLLLSDRIESLNKEFQIMKDDFSTDRSEATETIPEVSVAKITEVEEEKPQVKEEIRELEVESKKEDNVQSNGTIEPINEESETIKNDSEAILNDQLQNQSSEVIGEKLNTSKLSDIQSAIGINDRFLFIRELFENNSDAYNECINFINNTNDLNAIERHFQSKTNWDFENPTVIQFMELTKRKF